MASVRSVAMLKEIITAVPSTATCGGAATVISVTMHKMALMDGKNLSRMLAQAAREGGTRGVASQPWAGTCLIDGSTVTRRSTSWI